MSILQERYKIKDDIKNRPIGVFDSGVGGLSAVKELSKILPNEDIIYFGDTGRVPYGNKSRETIIRYAKQDISFLMSKGVKMIVAACGTVSSVASNIGDNLLVPFTGVLGPTSAEAIRATNNKKIGIIGTSATINSSSYKKEINKIDSEIQVFEQDCPLLVPLVENGFIDKNNNITKLTVEHYLAPLKDKGIDTLILGCTHYPIISAIISDIMGSRIKLIDSGKETALYTSEILKNLNIVSNSTVLGSYSFYVSDVTEGFSNIASLFLSKNFRYIVEQVDIESFLY